MPFLFLFLKHKYHDLYWEWGYLLMFSTKQMLRVEGMEISLEFIPLFLEKSAYNSFS